MFGTQPGQTIQFGQQTGQGIAQCQRQECLGPAVALIERAYLRPGAQHPQFVAGFGAEGA